MLGKGLIQGADANQRPGAPLWHQTGDGHGVTLVATAAGLAVIGIERGGREYAASRHHASADRKARGRTTPTETEAVPYARMPREGANRPP